MRVIKSLDNLIKDRIKCLKVCEGSGDVVVLNSENKLVLYDMYDFSRMKNYGKLGEINGNIFIKFMEVFSDNKNKRETKNKDEIKLHDHAITSICSNDYFVYTSDVTGIVKKFGASDRKIQHDFGVVCKGQILKMTIDADCLVICSEEGEIKVFSWEDDK